MPPPEESFSDYLNENNKRFSKQPNIPTKQQVWEYFSGAGGTREMAKKFFETHEATGWHYRGSPIVNFKNLAGNFIASWKDINERNKPKEQAHVPLKRI